MNDLFSKYEKYFFSLLLSASVLALFWQVQFHDFILYDDILYVTENHYLQKGLDWDGFVWALTATDLGFWHPLTWLSLMLDYQIYGLNAGGYHWTNVLLHMTNTVLLFLVLSRMTKATWKSALVAALFALHPLHVESVAWVSQRKDVLSTLFLFLAIMAYAYYVRRPGICRYLFVVLLYVLGLMSKPMIVTLPLLLLLLDYWPLRRFPAHSFHSMGAVEYPVVSPFRLLIEKIPLFFLAMGLTVLTFYTEGKIGALKSLEMFPVEVRAANAIVSYGEYIWKMIWPTDLAIFYPHPGMLPSWRVISSGAILLIITVLVVSGMKRYPFLFSGWFWYVLTLSPVIGLVQIGGHAMADRYTYIPLIGLFIMMVWGLSHFIGGWQYKRVFFLMSSVFFLSVFTVLSWSQIQLWRDNIPLFQHARRVTENNYVIYNNLGAALFHKGKWDEAADCFMKALQIKPDYVDALNNMGLVMASQGNQDHAVSYYLTALKIKPNDAKVHNNLAGLMADQGKLDKAIVYYREALKIRPDDADVHYNTGMILARQHQFDASIRHFEEALRINPNHIAARKYLNAVLKKTDHH